MGRWEKRLISVLSYFSLTLTWAIDGVIDDYGVAILHGVAQNTLKVQINEGVYVNIWLDFN